MEPSDILLLQETKIEEEALLSLSRSKWEKNAGMDVSARGTSGGLATIWSEDKFLLNASCANQSGKKMQAWMLVQGALQGALLPYGLKTSFS